MIWTYWEGDKPYYIDLCLRLMKLVLGGNVTVLTPETVPLCVGTSLDPNYLRLPNSALRADCIRAAVLATYGGWWWDADTVALRDPTDQLDPNEEHEILYCAWTRPPRRVLNGYIRFSRGSKVAQSWLNAVNNELSNNFDSIDWCYLGERLLTGLVPACPTSQEIDRRLVLPVDIDSDVEQFFKPHRGELIPPDAYCYGLNHSYFMYHHQKQMNAPPDRWTDILIHRLMAYMRGIVDEG